VSAAGHERGGPGAPVSAARIDAILFDLGACLIELAGVEQMLAWCPDLAGIDELWRRWLGSPAVRRYETGAATRAAFADEIIREFALPVDADTFLDAFASWPRALFPARPRCSPSSRRATGSRACRTPTNSTGSASGASGRSTRISTTTFRRTRSAS